MHSFLFHLGDYYAHTAHLSPIEDLAYRRLIDHYYLHQKPLAGSPAQLARAIRLRDNVDEVAQVLAEFFQESLDGEQDSLTSVWRNKRCDTEIERYKKMAEGGKSGASKRWSKGGDSPPIAPLSPPHQPPNANQEPLTINQEPSTTTKRSSRGSRLSIETLPSEWDAFCRRERPDLIPSKVFEMFRDYWISVAGAKGSKADWFATWKNWVRNQRQTMTEKQRKDDGWQAKLHGHNTIDMELSDGQVLSTDTVPF